jgi:imidazolonepropionase-like amidohydrolase
MNRTARFVPAALLAVALFAIGPAAAQECPIVLKAGTILNGKGQILRNTIIVVDAGKIARIGGDAPASAITYDLTSLTVTPGWIDTHAHIFWHFDNGRLAGKDEPPIRAMLHATDNAIVTLNAGFTTIQSPGSPEDKDLREAIARGIIPGPRMLTSLEPLDEKSGPPEKLRELVRERKQQGADFIKLFASKSIREGGTQTMTDEQLRAACGEAKSLGLRTIVHAHSAESAKAATLAGCTSIEHGAYVTDEVFTLMAQQGKIPRHRQLQRTRLRVHGEGYSDRSGHLQESPETQRPENCLWNRRGRRRSWAQLRGIHRPGTGRRPGSHGGADFGYFDLRPVAGLARQNWRHRSRDGRRYHRHGWRPLARPYRCSPRRFRYEGR